MFFMNFGKCMLNYLFLQMIWENIVFYSSDGKNSSVHFYFLKNSSCLLVLCLNLNSRFHIG